MRSALYYPHTTIEDEALVKTALILWDRLEFIVPWRGFRPDYDSRDIARAMELIGSPHCPDDAEKKKTHKHIEEIINRRLPPQFYFSKNTRTNTSVRRHEHYEIYPQKLMPQTWQLLRRSRLAGGMLPNFDYPMTEPAGLIIMSVLADCCAGATRSRVTDRGEAYATLAGILGNDLGDETGIDYSEQSLVPIALKVVDAPSIEMNKLIEFRVREQNEFGHTLRDLRHRYVDALEKYVKLLVTTKGNASDVDEIRRQFEDDMSADLQT